MPTRVQQIPESDQSPELAQSLSATEVPAPENPAVGGAYVRHPSTGELTRVAHTAPPVMMQEG